MTLTLAEQLMHTTVRLECQLASGGTSTGTGFFFTFQVNDKQEIPVIITNKHVINGSTKGMFVLTKATPSNEPIIGTYEKIVFDNFESHWIKHPDPDVDLAVFPIAPLLRQTEKNNMLFFSAPLVESFIPSAEQLKGLSGLEDITMVGYPNGIWDEKNNLPIIRKGVTATSPKYDYNGLPLFVIDCACFPGSSGSPVLIFNQNGYTDARGNTYVGSSRIILLGALFAGPQHIAEGEIKTINLPLAQVPISLSKIPNNLGFVVKSQKIMDFKSMLMINSKTS
jgi:Trypsin-like peptidase domain